jgi:hypothetical protein
MSVKLKMLIEVEIESEDYPVTETEARTFDNVICKDLTLHSDEGSFLVGKAEVLWRDEL